MVTRGAGAGIHAVTPVVVRLALPGDLPAVFRIRVSVQENHLSMAQLTARGITPAWIARLMAEGALRTWCAECHGEVVGFSMVNVDAREVFALFVAPQHEGRGVGSRLLEVSVAELLRASARPLRLTTGSGTRAHSFYLRRGWQQVGVDPRNDDVLLELDPGHRVEVGETRWPARGGNP